MDEFKFEIVKKIGVLSENENGWKKEINMVSWNERNPKLDIREWAPDNAKMKKGITLSHKEAVELKLLLASIELEDAEQGGFRPRDGEGSVDLRPEESEADEGIAF